MIRFFDMFSGIGGFRAVTANVVHALGLRLKAAHRGSVGATRAGKEAAL